MSMPHVVSCKRSDVQLDPRYERVTSLIRNGEFGWEDYFAPMVDSITHGSDYYLLANDFPSYIDAQVPILSLYIYGPLKGPVLFLLCCFCVFGRRSGATTAMKADIDECLLIANINAQRFTGG